MKCNSLKNSVIVLVLLAGYAESVKAQTIHFQTESRSQLHMLGDMSRIVGNKAHVTDAYMSKDYMLEENKKESTLFSVVDERITMMDHKKKTYFHLGFDEMASYFSQITQDTQREIEDSGQEMPEVEFDLSVEDMGESQEISGHKAERKLMRIEMKFTTEQTDGEGNTETASGKFYTVVDMWVSKNVPGYDVMDAYAKNYAETLGESFSQGGAGFSGIAQVMQQDPRIGPALERAQEEIQKTEGLALKSTTYFVVGPMDEDLDIDAVLGRAEVAKEEKKKRRRGRVGQLARGALRQQGLNVGGNDTAADQGDGEIQEQRILVETETMYTKFELVDDNPDRFNVPASYKEVDKPSYFGSEDQ